MRVAIFSILMGCAIGTVITCWWRTSLLWSVALYCVSGCHVHDFADLTWAYKASTNGQRLRIDLWRIYCMPCTHRHSWCNQSLADSCSHRWYRHGFGRPADLTWAYKAWTNGQRMRIDLWRICCMPCRHSWCNLLTICVVTVDIGMG
jgi:hypothetical protein